MILISIISSLNHKIEIIYLKAFLNIELINELFFIFRLYIYFTTITSRVT